MLGRRYKESYVFAPLRGGPRYPTGWDPLYWCVIFHPFSFVYVNTLESKHYPGFDVYAVPKKELTDRLKEWEVQIEDTDPCNLMYQ